MNLDAGHTELLGAYRQAMRELIYRRTRVGYLLVLVLMPAGAALDYFSLYGREEAFWPVLNARLVCTGALLVPYGLLLTAMGRRQAWPLSTILVVAPVFTMSWMIYITEGEASSYYAGLNLMIIGACQLLPWTIWHAGGYCALVLVCYILACVMHRGEAFIANDFVNNLFFILLTTIICVTFCQVSSRLRFNDFRLRHELDQRNREINHSYEKLAELDRLKSQFFANISHELRTPLTLILSPIESLLHREPPLPDEVGHWLIIAKNNGLRLLKLINDLLEIIRLEEGKLKIDRKPIDLGRFTPGIVQSMRHLAQGKQLTMSAAGPEQSVMIRGDASRLEKVLLNLLTNAIKFTDPGGGIEVTWRDEDDWAVIDVRDNGIGIPEGDLPYVFDRFRQVDGSSSRKYQGVGLGLALAKELVEEHGGELVAHSDVGVGTTFTIRLPTAIDITEAERQSKLEADGSDSPAKTDASFDPIVDTFRAADLSAPGTSRNASGTPAEVGQGEHRILIVDDEPDMRAFLISILRDEYRVIEAADGTAGLALARELRPDLIVLDLMLPGMDGLAVCRALRKDATLRGVKIVLLTARVDEGSKIEGLDRGADDFLTKPFSTVEIKTRLRNLLSTARLQRDLRDRNEALERTLAQLRATESQLVQSEKMNALGSLAAGLLHEINNPLNYTLTALELAEMSVSQSDDADMRDTLGDIGEGMRRIRDIITDLRAFAYPEQGDSREPFAVADAVRTAVRFTARQRNGHMIEIDLPDDLIVAASRTQITQVFVNLITNALIAIEPVHPSHGGMVRINAERQGDRLEIRIRDNGTGIDAKIVPRIFDPFFTTGGVGKGMGLGLSICHTIVRNHGGEIRVYSEGDGAEFRFDLPLAKPQES